MASPRRIRWYGDPTEERQPDAGDVLSYSRPPRPDWWHLVHYSWRVRGGGPEDLWLMVERLDFVDGWGIPDPVVEAFESGNYFTAQRGRRPASKDTP
jgi:hypothetical protein